jgi:hypothetical protein
MMLPQDRSGGGNQPKGPKGSDGPQPIVQSFILADHVYIDSKTGKKIIAGTFNRVALGEGQSSLHPVVAYLALVGCHGPVSLQVRLADLDDGKVLRSSGVLRFDARDPLETYEVVIEVPPLPLPHEGIYALEALCNDQLAGNIRLHVARRKRPPETV